MSYKSLIGRNVKLAFTLCKDLADDVVLTQVSGSSFDFNTSEVTNTEDANKTVKMLIFEKETKSRDGNTLKQQVIFDTNEVGDLTRYSTITHNSVVWKIGPIISTDRFVTIAELYR